MYEIVFIDLKKHVAKIINFENKEMIPLTNEENESHIKLQVCHICKKEFIFDIDSCSENIYTKYRRVRDHCHYTKNTEVLLIIFVI